MTPNHAPASDRASSDALVNVARRPPRPERLKRWQKAAAVALGLALVASGVEWSAAQRRPRITAPRTIQAEPASQASLAIKVDPIEDLPSNSFLRLRGFPTSVSLTEGHAIAPGAWAIPLFGLASLKAIVPAGVSGRAEIVITLVDVDGTTLAQTKTSFVIAAAPPTPPAAALRPAALPVKKVPPRPPGVSEEQAAQAERMLANGEKQLEQGNIGAAQGFLRLAAEAGSAEAALKLGATYDPAELKRIAPLALSGTDPKEARKWYEKARDLGSPEADSRLGRLGGR